MKNNADQFKGVNTNISYFTLRKIIGWSGILLPFLAWGLAWKYEPSISDYYYTRSGVLFTSVLTLCGAFLMSYKGYEVKGEKISDNVITWFGGAFIVIVAAIPTPYRYGECNCPTPICHVSDMWGGLHFGFAALFFAAMGYLSVFHFTRSGSSELSSGKIIRNWLYRVCGIAMWVTLLIAGILIFGFHVDKTEAGSHIVLWVEIILLFLFGTSWLVKGKGLVDLGLQKDD